MVKTPYKELSYRQELRAISQILPPVDLRTKFFQGVDTYPEMGPSGLLSIFFVNPYSFFLLSVHDLTSPYLSVRDAQSKTVLPFSRT